MKCPGKSLRGSWLFNAVTAGALLAVALARLADANDVAEEAPLPTVEELEAAGAIVGRIIIDRDNVFDTSLPGENNAIYRFANRWHVITREAVVSQQLLFRTGDPLSARLLAESERLLRANRYLYDARITPVSYADGVVDIRVWTRDLWTLNPGISLSRSGGENRSSFRLSEQNLLGRGIRLRVSYSDDVDRTTTSYDYLDRNVGDSWVSASAEYRDSSDGGTTQLSVVRPFYALDARWSAGGWLLDDDREVAFYDLGEEVSGYRARTDNLSAFWGRSAGLVDGWTRRWTTGVVYDDRLFEPVPDGDLPDLVPDDRKLVYPFLGFEMLEDRFETATNRDQIARTEDFYLGTRIAGRIGWSDASFGADRDALLYSFSASRGFGSMDKKSLFLAASVSGRVEQGDYVDNRLLVNARYYNQITEKRLFYVTFESLWGGDLDLDSLVDLGGDNGLKGYPLRYQTGDSLALLSLEQRYFTDWYPLRLFRVGGAAFASVGRTWGDNPAGGAPLGWLRSVGVGLRLAPTRRSGRDMIHVDVAFPLDGDPTIDGVQFLLETKRSF